MRQKQGVFSLFLLSPSSRRAWIEITKDNAEMKNTVASPSSRRAWIEIQHVQGKAADIRVALLAEGVDRNYMSVRDLSK